MMHNPDAIVLIDTGGKKSDDDFRHAGFAMVTASPAAIPKEMNKEALSSLAYLPVWTKKEVDCAFKKFPDEDRQNMNLYLNGQTELNRRYAFAGGVPRIVFGLPGPVKRYEKGTNTAISDATENIRPHVSLAKNVHKVFHIFSGETLEEYKFEYATEEIGKKFVELLTKLKSDQIKVFLSGFVNGNVRLSALQSGVGVLYEGTIHGMLASSFHRKQGKIKWHLLKPRKYMAIGKLEEDRDEELFSVDDIDFYYPNTYYVPDRANQPVIDSWTKFRNELYFFQITIKKTRTFGAKEHNFFQDIMNKKKDIRIRFIYVVPSIIEKDFQISDRNNNRNVSTGVLGVNVLESELELGMSEQFRAWEESVKNRTRDATT